MKTKFLLAIFLLIPSVMMATQQEPDFLLVDGQKLELLDPYYYHTGYPLDDFFSEKNPRPEFFHKEGSRSTGNGRGYVATWEIKEGKLYLAKVEKTYRLDDDIRIIPAERFMPGKAYPVFADWFSGVLQAVESRYSQEIIFYSVKHGALSSRSILEFTQFNRRYRSQEDIDWRAQGDPLRADDEAWTDARLLVSEGGKYLAMGSKGVEVKTRGIYRQSENEKFAGHLWIPMTPGSTSASIPLDKSSQTTTIADGTFVEIEGRLVYNVLVAEKIRPLSQLEGIHNPNYPEINYKLRGSHRAYLEKAAEIVRDSMKKADTEPSGEK